MSITVEFKISEDVIVYVDKENIESALGNRDIWFLAGQESRECFIFISDVGISGIFLVSEGRGSEGLL